MNEHDRLLQIMPKLETDYAPWGKVQRWLEWNERYPDCSGGCRWARWLEDIGEGDETQHLSMDWLVCTNPESPRCGSLTFEHQAGFGCFALQDADQKELDEYLASQKDGNQ